MAFIQNTITDLDDLLYQISNITASGGNITVTTSVAHNITVGTNRKFIVSGTTNFNGEWPITAASGSSLTLTATGITATETSGQGMVNDIATNDTYFTQEITLNLATPTAPTFTLNAAGNLSVDGSGVTGQCLYSWFKERWKQVPSITKFEFPMLSITNEQFEFIKNWKPASDTTRKKIRTAGWAETNAAGAVGRRYAGIISLGTLGTSDQPYYVQNSSFTATTANTTYTGPVNEAVQIFGNTAVDVSSPINSDLSGYFKIFVRTRGKTYADADLIDIGVSQMTYIVYRFPVSNGNDLNINTTSDNAFSGAAISTISGNGTTITVDCGAVAHGLYAGAPVTITGATGYNGTYTVASVTSNFIYTITNPTNAGSVSTGTSYLGYVPSLKINYLPNPDTNAGNVVIRGEYRGPSNDQTIIYNLGDVVWNGGTGGNGRWYYLDATNGTASTGTNVGADTGKTWTAWTAGERDIEENGTYSAYTVVYELNNNLSSPGATKEVAYEYAQYALRKNADINDHPTSDNRNGNIADTLVYFIGSQLHTYADTTIPSAVVLDDISGLDVNNVTYHDWANGLHFAPTVVLCRILFNNNLSSDADAVFYAYYTAGEGLQADKDFGTKDAILLKESNGTNVGQTVKTGMSKSYDVPSTGEYQFNYAYTADTTNGRSGGDVSVTVVSIGLQTGQYVSTTGTITSAGATFSLVAPLERNYEDPGL